MSIRATLWAWEQKKLHGDMSPTALLVLLAMADQAWDSGLTWASAAYFGDKTGFNEKTVRTAAKELVGLGLLRIEERKGLTPKLWLQLRDFVVKFTPEGGSGVRGTEFRSTPDNDAATPEPPSVTPVTGSDEPITNLSEPEHTWRSSTPELLKLLLEAAGPAANQTAIGMHNLAPILGLMETGAGPPCDLELDIIPTIRAICATKSPGTMRGWGYFTNAICENRNLRLSGAPALETPNGRQRQSTRDHRAEEFDADLERSHAGAQIAADAWRRENSH